MFRRGKDGVRVKRPITRHLYDRFMHKYFAHDVNFELQLLARHAALGCARLSCLQLHHSRAPLPPRRAKSNSEQDVKGGQWGGLTALADRGVSYCEARKAVGG